MQWSKLGVVWKPDSGLHWARSHASCPTPLQVNETTIRVYIQCRDASNIGRVGYVDVDADNPMHVLKISTSPVLDVGVSGAFDDNGVFQTCILQVDASTLYMYYVGFELGVHIRYRLLTGLAISKDGGETFQRVKRTPILERSENELHFRCGPFVFRENGYFRMWYVAGSQWIDINGKQMPVYDLRYIESNDGIHWPEQGKVCLQLEQGEHGFGRPYVVKQNGRYRLFYSIRNTLLGQYRMGYAESDNGLDWVRLDERMGLDVSPTGWDEQSVEYAAPITVRGKTWLFYNGNDFGGTGFGVAELKGQ